LTLGTVFLGLVTACSSIATPPALLTQGPQQNKPEATAVTPEPTQSAEMMEQDIVDVAVEDGRYSGDGAGGSEPGGHPKKPGTLHRLCSYR
jgi:hypothetical protein